ncbi:kinesin-like protein KIF23 isoform X2 [Formica exsecta]|uniref:kinesin-like protein KIF23 isoform X2 n=1 Tax=Formica exsecta TaxID=72781 RepID=UPI001141DFDA|nr:kinesin-like protein KIF23 isoform X2 [Formica exsecta]
MGDSFPKTKLIDPEDEQVTAKLMQFLETYIQRRDLLQKDVHKKQNNFRNILVELERENVLLKYSNTEQKKMISVLQNRICKLQNQIDSLLYKLNSACDIMRNMQQKLRNRDRQLKQHAIDKQRILQRCNAKIQRETDRMINESDMKLHEQHKQLTSYIRKKDDKLKLMKQILMSTDENMSDANAVLMAPIALNTTTKIAEESIPIVSKEEPVMVISIDSQIAKSHRSQQTLPFCTRINLNDIQGKIAKEPIPMTSKEEPSSSQTEIAESESIRPTRTDSPLSSHSATIALAEIATINKFKSDIKIKIPVVNPRYRRSQNDKWINHRSVGMVPTGTIFQPQIHLHKRIRKLTNPNNFAVKSAKYCLYAQEQDTDGELETKLYKADILPTCGGGAQIVFKDIECLKQISPTAAKRHNGQKTWKTV